MAPPFKSPPTIEQIARGRIEFIRSIRDDNFSAYKSLAKKFNTLKDTKTKKFPIPTEQFLDLMNQNVFVLQNSNKYNEALRQGTAFYLHEIKGIITCSHVLDKDGTGVDNSCDDFWLFAPSKPTRFYKMKVRHRDPHIDLAILDFENLNEFTDDYPLHVPLILQSLSAPTQGQHIKLIGWPQFAAGHNISIRSGEISSTRITSAVPKFVISAQIIQGNSGGPILDKDGFVIGIAQAGNNALNKEEVAEYIAIDASNIKKPTN